MHVVATFDNTTVSKSLEKIIKHISMRWADLEKRDEAAAPAVAPPAPPAPAPAPARPRPCCRSSPPHYDTATRARACTHGHITTTTSSCPILRSRK